MSNYEKNLALRQGHGIASEDGYFEARPQIDSMDRRKVFGAGFERGWEAALAAAPAQPVAEPAEVSAVESNTAGAAIAAGAVYAELPMQFACSGVFPVYSADQMRAFADGTHALRTKSEASREFLERMLSAMEGVIDVADRKTAEFDALRSCVVDLTLMLFKPEALRASRGQAPAQAAPAYKDSTPELHIGDSAFESWYSTYSPAHKSDKQRVRDAYAAGMGDPLVVAAPTPQTAAQDAERYRLLNLGVDVIQADDEFLSDDTTTWATDPNGVFVGMPYQGYALLPARRKLVAAIAAQQGDSHE